MRYLLTSLLCVFTLSLTAQVDCLGPDFNNDGEIGTADLIAFLSYYGNDWPDESVADIPGCMDDTSCNYNAGATVDDASCDYASALSLHERCLHMIVVAT